MANDDIFPTHKISHMYISLSLCSGTCKTDREWRQTDASRLGATPPPLGAVWTGEGSRRVRTGVRLHLQEITRDVGRDTPAPHRPGLEAAATGWTTHARGDAH